MKSWNFGSTFAIKKTKIEYAKLKGLENLQIKNLSPNLRAMRTHIFSTKLEIYFG